MNYFQKRKDNTIALMATDVGGSYQVCTFPAKQSVQRSGDYFELTADDTRDWQIQYLNFNDFNLELCKPQIIASDANAFFAQLSVLFFSVSFPAPSEKRIVKFVKSANGNVLLKKMDNTLIASFSASQSIIKDLTNPDRFLIQSETAYNVNPIVFHYEEVWGNYCEPSIDSNSIDSLLNELSQKFFFETATPKVQEVAVNNFPSGTGKFFKVYENPQYRGNVYNFTASIGSKPYIVQSVLNIGSTANFSLWTTNHFDNEAGSGTMPRDYEEDRLLLTADTFQLNGMYFKVSSTFNYFGGKYHLLRIYQDVRTNEVYLMANDSVSTGTFVKFDFTTLKAVDGGFYISCPVFNLKIEIRNKFF